MKQERCIISNPRSASISNNFNSRFIVESSERKPLDHVSHSGPFIYHGSSFNSNSTCDNQIKKSIWKNYESRFMHLDDIKVSENHKRINSCREHRLVSVVRSNYFFLPADVYFYTKFHGGFELNLGTWEFYALFWATVASKWQLRRYAQKS